MPKCEFNVRWEACIRRSIQRSLEDHRRVVGKSELTTEQRKLLWAYGKPRDLKEALQSMSIVYDMVRLQEQITLDIVKYYRADNVLYLEIHVNPCVNNELSPEIFLRKMIQAISFAKSAHRNMTVKILLIAELEESIERVQEVIDLVLIFGRTRRNQNLPDSDIIHGVEIVFVDSNEYDMYQLKKMIEFIRQESDLLIIFNLAKMSNNMNQLYDILSMRPDRLCNAEILNQNQNEIDQRIITDRLLSMKLPIVLQTGYSMLLGCTLSDEYYQLATVMDLKPSDIYELSLTASFFTEKTPRIKRRNLFPFAYQYDQFAELYMLENSTEWKLQILRDCKLFLSRPLTCKRKQRRRRIIDLLYV
ncbi:unnamed protein product [Acanthocheilonema viteae]|uniref:Adenosine deaminase domain-containing protein n=1 Tax=Acanthocheilonema viteae TaxID=6277 RepID=A0A498SQT3_ACAVI|nr:unnamed protein product [Acanthocheilonema viteae]